MNFTYAFCKRLWAAWGVRGCGGRVASALVRAPGLALPLINKLAPAKPLAFFDCNTFYLYLFLI